MKNGAINVKRGMKRADNKKYVELIGTGKFLIWSDNKLVMSSLIKQGWAGKINLIYITENEKWK